MYTCYMYMCVYIYIYIYIYAYIFVIVIVIVIIIIIIIIRRQPPRLSARAALASARPEATMKTLGLRGRQKRSAWAAQR